MPDKETTPVHGDIYEAEEDFTIIYKTILVEAFSNTGKATFPAGDRLIIDTCGRKGINVYCDAVNYDSLEKLIVPETMRTSQNYNGYYFHLAVTTLLKHCKKILR